MTETTKLRWIANRDLSAGHACYVVATGTPCSDAQLESLLVDTVTDINSRINSGAMDVRAFWQRYLAELHAESDTRAATVVALADAGCSELQLDQTARTIGGRLRDARQMFLDRFPKVEAQLKLRAEPLRERWDAVGSNLLREVQRQIWDDSPPIDWWPDPVTLFLVQPIRGGDGGIDLPTQSAWIEPMLQDLDPAVPEVLRVGWLVSRLAIDLHVMGKTDQLTLTHGWLLVSFPLVLTAAQRCGIITEQSLPIAEAMQSWHLGDERLAGIVTDWWTTYLRGQEPLPLAMRRLIEAIDRRTR